MQHSRSFSHAVNFMFIIINLLIIMPFVLLVAVSFSTEDSVFKHGYRFIPETFTLQAYKVIFEIPQVIFRAYGVTIIVTVVGTIVSILVTSMIAYVISRRDYKLRNLTAFYIFFTMLFSGGLIPWYILVTRYLHLKDMVLALIVTGLFSPWNAMVMKGFFSKIPLEIIESAKMDGAGEWRIFFRIIAPLSTPALATMSLLISFAYWNEWFRALLLIDSQNLVPLQLLLVRMLNSMEVIAANMDKIATLNIDISQFPTTTVRMAMVVVVAGPMLFVFPFFQRYFVQGLTIGSLKG